jgi:hypothetical protein
VLPNRGVKKTKGGTGRRRTPTDSDDEENPVVTPYKWSTSTTRVKQTKRGPIAISTRATAITADADSAANSSESEDEEGDSVEVMRRLLNCASWTTGTSGPRTDQRNGRMRIKETVFLRDGATMPTNTSIQSATGSGRSVKQTNRRQWNWCFLTMQSNSMDVAPNELGQGS